jgi:hypothetical protein
MEWLPGQLEGNRATLEEFAHRLCGKRIERVRYRCFADDYVPMMLDTPIHPVTMDVELTMGGGNLVTVEWRMNFPEFGVWLREGGITDEDDPWEVIDVTRSTQWISRVSRPISDAEIHWESAYVPDEGTIFPAWLRLSIPPEDDLFICAATLDSDIRRIHLGMDELVVVFGAQNMQVWRPLS